MALRMEQLITIGILLIIVGLFIVFFGVFKAANESNAKTKVAVGGFIGPILFGFGNDKNLVWLVAILSLIVFLVLIFTSIRFGK